MWPRGPKVLPCGAGARGLHLPLPCPHFGRVGEKKRDSLSEPRHTSYIATPHTAPPHSSISTRFQQRRYFRMNIALFSKPTPHVLIQMPHVISSDRSGNLPTSLRSAYLATRLASRPFLPIFRFSSSLRRPSSISVTSRSVTIMRRNIYCAASYILL